MILNEEGYQFERSHLKRFESLIKEGNEHVKEGGSKFITKVVNLLKIAHSCILQDLNNYEKLNFKPITKSDLDENELKVYEQD